MKEKFKSIKREIVAVIVFLTMAVTVIMSVMLLSVQKKSLLSEVELRGLSIARNIANNIADFMLLKYDLESAKILREAMQNKGVKYALVTDPKGTILAHNDMTLVRSSFVPPGKKSGMTPGKNIVYEGETGERVIDFTSPVVAKRKVKIGVVHVGISYNLILNALNKTYASIAFIAIVAFALSLLGAFLLSAAITKPIDVLAEGARIAGSGNLDHKIEIKKRNELGLLADTFNAMTEGLKKAREAELQRIALEKELEIANRIQDSLLPKSFPDMKRYEAASFYKSAKEIGGDYYDVIALGGHRFGIVIADVSGKGIPAALIMTMLSGILNIEARANADPVRVMIKLNDTLLTKVSENMFATVFYAVLDIDANSVEMVSAGHHEAMVYSAATAAVENYCPRGAAIGVLKGRAFEERLEKKTAVIGAGDRLLLFTDGISDAKAGNGQRFGMERVRAALQNNGKKTCAQITEKLVSEVEAFTGGQEQSDDIAVLSIGRTA